MINYPTGIIIELKNIKKNYQCVSLTASIGLPLSPRLVLLRPIILTLMFT